MTYFFIRCIVVSYIGRQDIYGRGEIGLFNSNEVLTGIRYISLRRFLSFFFIFISFIFLFFSFRWSSTVSNSGFVDVLQGMITHWTIPYVVHGSLAVVSTVLVIVILPETGGSPLPEHVPGNETTSDIEQTQLEEILTNSAPEA